MSKMELLNPGSVTIIRKKGDEYTHESISTRKMLPGTTDGEMEIRKNAIARLRKDPSVIVVLENKRGHCDETFEHEGFNFKVTIIDDDKPFARMKITYDGNTAYEERYVTDAEADDYYNSAIYKLLVDIEKILYDIDHEAYWFVRADCPGFEPREEEEEVETMYEIAELLKKHSYQYEELHTIGYAAQPLLFVHENEVMMLGERHFSGSIFVEMKRVWDTVDAKIIVKAIESLDMGWVDCFQYEDGSWGFRTYLDGEVYKSTFEQLLAKAITQLREVVEKLEANNTIGPEVFSITNAQRSLFIYEVIDSSLKLSKLSI